MDLFLMLKRLSGASSITRSNTPSAHRGTRTMWEGLPRSTSRAPTELRSSPNGSSSSTTDVWPDSASIRRKERPRMSRNYSSPPLTISRTRQSRYPGGSAAYLWGRTAILTSSEKRSPGSMTGAPWPRSSATEPSQINYVRNGINSKSSTRKLTGCWSDAAYARPAWKQGKSRLRSNTWSIGHRKPLS